MQQTKLGAWSSHQQRQILVVWLVNKFRMSMIFLVCFFYDYIWETVLWRAKYVIGKLKREWLIQLLHCWLNYIACEQSISFCKNQIVGRNLRIVALTDGLCVENSFFQVKLNCICWTHCWLCWQRSTERGWLEPGRPHPYLPHFVSPGGSHQCDEDEHAIHVSIVCDLL